MDEPLPTTWRVEFIHKKEFAKAAMDENVEVFVIHVFSISLKSIYPNKVAQIASLLTKEVINPDKYLDFAIVFLK